MKKREIYFGGFGSKEDIEHYFQVTLPKDFRPILCWYGNGGYEGSATVVYRSEGKLWEAHGSHCSCNGLEEQWAPEETSKKALRARMLAAISYGVVSWGSSSYYDEDEDKARQSLARYLRVDLEAVRKERERG